MGTERIVYGDKVINLSNHRRVAFPEGGALNFLANGEIGIAVGQFAPNGNPSFLNVEFTSQKGFTYGFRDRDFRDEGDAALELAYALTIHKSQGSQFELVLVVIPEGHPMLSRELLYTALTRHQRRVVVLHQGPRTALKDIAAPHRSETARRMTNLVSECRMVDIPQQKGSTFLQDGLIYRTNSGLAVRSKSEWIIADALAHAGVAFSYERALRLGGYTRYPDFTIEDDVMGRTFYWEHLGMLDHTKYREDWERKLAWYRANGVLPAEEGEGANGTLVTTTESAAKPLDIEQIRAVIARLQG
jgi:hypothetical protein